MFLVAALLAAVQDAPLSSYDPSSIAAFLQAEGYRAKLTKDAAGDPMIQSGTGGTRFTLFFYNCEKNARCEDMQFHASWDTGKKDPSLATINQWNWDKRFARAYLDKDNDPHLELDVVFTEGQMSPKAFREHLDIFADLVGAFEKHIGWDEAEPEDARPAAAARIAAR